MRVLRRFSAVVAVVASALVATSGPAPAQDAKSKEAHKGPSAAQKTEGVVTKVEPVKSKDGKDTHRVRLTIKTDAVWRDYVRDTSNLSPDASTKAVARKGKQGIASEGQPSSPETRVVVDVVGKTTIESRFRAATDETNAGSSTVAAARARKKDPDSQARQDQSSRSAARLTRLSAKDLKPGLFVEVEYRHGDDSNQNPASRVIVLRPIEGPQAPPSDEVKTRRSDESRSK